MFPATQYPAHMSDPQPQRHHPCGPDARLVTQPSGAAATQSLPGFGKDRSLPGAGPLGQSAEGRYDTVLPDLPGNLGDTPVLAEVLAGSDLAIVPLVPERAAAMSILGTFHPDTLITGVAPCRSAES